VQKPLNSILAGIVALALLATLAHSFARPLGQVMQQPIAWTTDLLFPDFDVIDMHIADRRGELVYEVALKPHRPFVVGLHWVNDPRILESQITASTPMTRWFQQAILALVLVLAWPALHWRRRILGLAVALALIPLAVVADAPFVLAGALDDMLRATFAPETVESNWLWQWMRFMEGGGRLALGMGVGLAAVAVAGGLGLTVPELTED